MHTQNTSRHIRIHIARIRCVLERLHYLFTHIVQDAAFVGKKKVNTKRSRANDSGIPQGVKIVPVLCAGVERLCYM